MLEYDERLDFLTTFYSLAHLNFSPVLSQTSQGEFFVLAAIRKLEKLETKKNNGISGIADSLHVSSPAISRTITSLENKGLVQRNIDRLNRRNTRVQLTALGDEVLNNECDMLCKFMSNVVNRMREDKIKELFRLSNELIENVEKELGNDLTH